MMNAGCSHAKFNRSYSTYIHNDMGRTGKMRPILSKTNSVVDIEMFSAIRYDFQSESYTDARPVLGRRLVGCRKYIVVRSKWRYAR